MRDSGSHFLQDDSMCTTHFCDKELFASRCGENTDAAMLCNGNQRVSDGLLSSSLLGRPCLLTLTSQGGHQGGHS